MWPWEHAAIGYLVLSIAVHLLRRRSPTETEAVVVVFASVLPDLVDKPLAWEFGVFASGYGIAHSVLFAVPACVAVVALSVVRNRLSVGLAFAVGYLVHLPMDVLPHYVRDGRLPVGRVLWPVSETESSYPGGFGGTLREYFVSYVTALVSGPPGAYTLGVAAAIVACLALWVYDGVPGVRWSLRLPARATRWIGRRE